MINHIEREHKIIEVPVDRIIPAPTYEQHPVQVPTQAEKIVEVARTGMKVETKDRIIEKVVPVENMVTCENIVPIKEEVIKTVDRMEINQVPVFTSQDRIVKVPEFQ